MRAYLCEHLYFLGEGRREHRRQAVLTLRHCALLDNLTNLWLKAHIEHAIGLV